LSAYHPDDARFQTSFSARQMSGGLEGQTIVYALAWIGTACWAVCFWWMHRLSSKQEMMLKELHDMTERIEKLSKAEHDLIKEVHPKVEEIKESVEDVSDAVEKQKQ
jgi:hypothetical protein